MARTKRVARTHADDQPAAKKGPDRPRKKPKIDPDNVDHQDGRVFPKAEDDHANDSGNGNLPEAQSQPSKSKKPQPSQDGNQRPTKAATRDSTRRSSREKRKTQRPTQLQLLNYLISQDAQDLCRPDDEREFLQAHGGTAKTYSSLDLNAYEELLSAVILSRRLSHRLGLRSIRTLLNPPYGFSSAKKTRDAGQERLHQALVDARTRYREKTAREVGELADVVLDKYSDPDDDEEGTGLGRLLRDYGGDIDALLDTLKADVKGFGNTTKGIFRRRIQRLWEDAYPYIDKKAGEDLKALGLPDRADELEEAIGSRWKQLDTRGVSGRDESERKRTAFATILERAIDAELEGKMNEVVVAAASA